MSVRLNRLVASMLLLISSCPALGDTIYGLNLGALTSGWTATWADESLSGVDIQMAVKSVDLSTSTVAIEIVKDFTGEIDPLYNIFPDGIITFTATGASPVRNIVISKETVYNHTRGDWTQFKWRLGYFNHVNFQSTAVTDWDVNPPFETLRLLTGAGQGDRLVASDGVVLDNQTFVASGVLRMEVHSPMKGSEFILKESIVGKPSPIPEPATLLMLSAGMLVLRRCRRRI